MANKQWRRNQAQDRYFQKAKAEGYRARSAYKLQELNEKFRVIRPADRVLDIGAAPGSWSQITSELVGPKGLVVAIDIQSMQPLDGVHIIRGDLRDPAVRSQILAATSGELFNSVISDIAPSTTGVRVTDHARSMELSLFALTTAIQMLRKGGNFVTKAFTGEDFDDLFALTKRYFKRATVFDPDATRKESKETFIVANNLVARATLDAEFGAAALLPVAPEPL